MRVATVAVWRPRDQRLPDFLSVCAEAGKIHERLGAEPRVWQAAYGGDPGTIAYVLEFDDLPKFAEFSTKLESDAGWQELVAKFVADPPADVVQNSMVTEPPLP